MYKSLNIKGKLYGDGFPKVMSVINLTPDSFFERSRCDLSAAEGADMVDAGACSTRPGGEPASEEDELSRLLGFMPEIMRRYAGLPVSIDTFRPRIAREMLERYGVDIINDVSGGCDEMFAVCAAHNAAYVLTWPHGGSVSDMLFFFSEKLDSLSKSGVDDVILDPGFGFGKDVENNYEIARNMEVLQEFGLPVLAGISRKRMLWQLLGTSPGESLNATTALNCMLLERGADIIRVHDTKEAKEAVAIYRQFHKTPCSNS